jgi:hypothetical protein
MLTYNILKIQYSNDTCWHDIPSYFEDICTESLYPYKWGQMSETYMVQAYT